jgi:hypothetical protein
MSISFVNRIHNSTQSSEKKGNTQINQEKNNVKMVSL